MLTVLVEKDFQCLHSADDDTLDAYPNPRASDAALQTPILNARTSPYGSSIEWCV